MNIKMNELTYMGYLTEADRASFIAEKAMNDEFEKLNILFEMCSLQQRIHEIDVENKVLTESGSYDDYAVLLMEANEQVSQEKQGILAKIFEWFANLFDSIHKAITGIFAKKVDANAQVNAPAAFFDQKFNGLIDGVLAVLNNDIVKMFASATVGAIATAFSNKIVGKVDELINWFTTSIKNGGMKLVAKSMLDGVTNKFQNLGKSVMDIIGKLKTKKPENDQAATGEQGMLKKLGELMSKVVNGGIQNISNVIANIGGGNNQQTANANAQAQPAAAPQQPQQAAPAPAPATNPQPAQPAQPVTASAETEKLEDNDLSLYESVFGKLDEDKKEDDISDLLSMI